MGRMMSFASRMDELAGAAVRTTGSTANATVLGMCHHDQAGATARATSHTFPVATRDHGPDLMTKMLGKLPPTLF